METGPQEVGVLDGHGFARGAVDDHRVDEVALFHQLLHRLQAETALCFHQLFTPVGEGQAILVDRHLTAVGDADHPQAGALFGQYRLLAGNLIHQGCTDAAHPDHEEIDELQAAKEVLVAGLDGFRHLAGAHDRGDGALARPLRDGDDVDGGLGQGGEEARRHPLGGAHAVTDEGDDGEIGHDLERVQQLVLELQLELALQHLAGLVAVVAVDTEADAVLGGRLGDQHDADPGAGDGGEDAAGHAHHALHAGAGDVEHAHAGEIRDGLHFEVIIPLLDADKGARPLRVEAVLDEAGNVELGHGGDGLRVQHLGTEVGELHRLFIGEGFEQVGIRYQARVAVVAALHVGPDLAALGIDAGGQDGCGIVGAVAAQQHGLALVAATGEARHQVETIATQPFGGEAQAGGFDVHVGFEVAAVGHQQLLRHEEIQLEATHPQQLVHEGDGEVLAPAQDAGLDVIRALPQQTDALHQPLHLIQLGGEAALQRLVIQRRVGGFQARQQAGEDAVDLEQGAAGIHAAAGLFHQGHQVVGHLGRCRQHQGHLGLPVGVYRDIGDPQETLCIGQ